MYHKEQKYLTSVSNLCCRRNCWKTEIIMIFYYRCLKLTLLRMKYLKAFYWYTIGSTPHSSCQFILVLYFDTKLELFFLVCICCDHITVRTSKHIAGQVLRNYVQVSIPMDESRLTDYQRRRVLMNSPSKRIFLKISWFITPYWIGKEPQICWPFWSQIFLLCITLWQR